MKPKYSCSNCNASLPWGVKFCPQCGQAVEWPVETVSQTAPSGRKIICPSCGADNESGVAHCRRCGTDLSGVRAAALQTAGRQEKREKSKSPRPTVAGLAPWKLIVGFFGVVAALLIITEIQRQPSSVPSMPAEQGSTPSQGANMESLQQIQELEERVKANPGDTKLLLDLANHLHDNRFWDRAITQYKKYLDAKPNDVNARVDLGICYKENGDLATAKQEMEAALKIDPNHLNAKFNLGIVALASGDLEGSNAWFQKVVAQDAQSEIGQRAQQLLTQHNPRTLNN